MKKPVSIAVLILLCCLFLCAGSEEEQMAVRVGERMYPRTLVQFTLTTALDLNEANGHELSEEEKQTLVDESLMRYVDIGILEDKLAAYGQNAFTEEEQENLQLYAEEAFETVWQGLYTRLREADDSVTEKKVTEWLISRGYTLDNFLQDAMASVRLERALELFCADVTLNSSEILNYYVDNFITPDRSAYENNVPRYEEEILLAGNESFYVPEGYVYIKHILLDFPQEVKDAMQQAAGEVAKAEEARQAAYNELAEAAANGVDIVPFKKVYDQRVAEKEQKEALFHDEMKKGLPALKEKTDEIRKRLQNGERFEDLMSEYSIDTLHQDVQDKGYLFHPDSEQWAVSFRDAASKLQKEGDLSEPVLTDAGVHIIRYMSAAEGGIHRLNDQEREALNRSALKAARQEVLNGLLAGWRDDYEWETHPELMSFE